MANGGWKNLLGERWVRRATADKTSGVSTVVAARLFSSGQQLVTPADVAQGNASAAAVATQTHLVSASSATQVNASFGATVAQTHLASAGNVAQANAAGQAAIVSPSLVSVASATQDNAVSPAQAHAQLNRILRVDTDPLEDGYLIVGDEGGQLVTVANVAQSNSASSAAISQATAVLVTTADVAQANTSSSAAISHTQYATIASVSQANSASHVAVMQLHLVAAANASQPNAVSDSAVRQTHPIDSASVSQANAAFSAAINQTHLITSSSSAQDNSVSASGISQSSTTFVSPSNAVQDSSLSAVVIQQTHLVGSDSSVQQNTVSQSAVNQIHQIFSAGVTQANSDGSSAIAQTHLVSIFSGAQANLVSGASAGHVVSGIGHVWRIDTSPFYANTLLIGDPGFGLLGSQIAATGDDGPGYLYNDISLPADADKEISGEIVTWPLHGELFADEDGSFIYTPDTGYVGTDSFEYQLRVEGEPIGSPTLVDLTVVGDTQYITICDALQGNSTSQVAVNQTHLATVGSVAQANAVSSVAINQSSETLVVAAGVAQENSASQVAVNQTHLISAANTTQENAVTPSSIALDGAHYLYANSVIQANDVSQVSIIQVTEGNGFAGTYDEAQARAKVHGERVAKVQQYQKLLAAQNKAEKEKPVEVPALLKPTEQIVINETALRYRQTDLSITDETQAFEISPELVAKLEDIRQVAIEQVDIPEIAPDHLAMIRNNDDALAMILIYWAAEEDA